MKPAVFLDRDGTLIESVHYLNKKEQVRILEGVPQALKALREAGYLLILVTNQAAIGKSKLSVDGLIEVQEHFDELLLNENVSIDAWYFCPEVRLGNDREAIEHPDRKPGPGMLLKAAKEYKIDLSQSWMVGDMVSDTLAGKNAGVLGTILVKTGLFDNEIAKHPSVDYVAVSFQDAKDIILQSN